MEVIPFVFVDLLAPIPTRGSDEWLRDKLSL